MGVAQAGVAFWPQTEISDLPRFVSGLFGEEYVEIAHPNVREFDIRHGGDVMVQNFDGAIFVCSGDLAWGHLKDVNSDLLLLHHQLGSPATFTVFCNYDSGGSYGYALVENGVRKRSRLQTMGGPQLPPLIEYGAPTAIEQRWLSAESYLEDDDCPIDERQRMLYLEDPRVEIAEDDLTGRVLHETLIAQFGVCPWETEAEPVYHFYRAISKMREIKTPEPPSTLPSGALLDAIQKQTRPWWRMLLGS
ncbi:MULTISPECIES: hypothetical protein [unclassified Variovorax]|jgi:hypothetical protein|uniref:hypothetical protein n=1 Tax=unclassified Variovorax TaxID=663243 RepID=UPI0008BF0E7C|nr:MULTISPECIES: hypothetical protein [unclassified Variovorax]SEK14969.1 hypothetical protein SAMN05518853_11643 [Variovorax sp. OK202]SFE07056.1 hypothetical protein SAMN05444746_11643 [Variovorax sp. OK212]